MLNSRDGEKICVDANGVHSALEHRHVGDLFNQVEDSLAGQLCLDTVLKVEGGQVVLMLYSRIMNLHKRVFLVLLLK